MFAAATSIEQLRQQAVRHSGQLPLEVVALGIPQAYVPFILAPSCHVGLSYWRSKDPADCTLAAPRSERAQLRQYVTDSRGTAQAGQHAVPQSMHPRS